MLTYRIDLEPDSNNTLRVTVPAFPEVTTFGDDEADALAHAADAIEEAIAARISDRDPVPPPDRHGEPRVRLPIQTAFKVALYETLRKSGINRAELGRRLGWKREQVDRLFRLDHASRIDQLESAFHALHYDADIDVRKRA
jgi:antitoxin HicB